MVVSVRESSQIIDDIFQAGHPVGLDGEGVNLGPKGQLTLVQVSLRLLMKYSALHKKATSKKRN